MAEVRNKQVILKNYVVDRFPKEDDMHVTSEATIKLKLPHGYTGVLVKNLYLSCDAFPRLLMHNQQYQYPNYTPASPLSGFGVPKVLDSGHSELKEGDLIWGSHDGRNTASSRGLKAYSSFLDTLLPYIRLGKIAYVEHIVEGLDNGPAALANLFRGLNVGKTLLLLAPHDD